MTEYGIATAKQYYEELVLHHKQMIHIIGERDAEQIMQILLRILYVIEVGKMKL